MLVDSRTRAVGLVLSALTFLHLACGSDTTSPADPGAGDGRGGGGDGSTPGVEVPAGCDPSKDPKDAPACVVDGFGLFVDGASGADTNQGTKASPLKTLAAAVKAASGRRVYVCEGTYAETVKVTAPVAIFGGFACGTWSYSAKKPVLAGPADKIPLTIEKVSGDVVVTDLSVSAAAATLDGGSSIAAFVTESSSVTFRRVDLEAKDGRAGKKGADGTTGTITAVTGGGAVNGDGYPAVTDTAGKQKVCTCSTGETSTGGSGGGPDGDGVPGKPALGAGAAGTKNTDCGAGGTGKKGADMTAAPNGAAATRLGTMSATTWAAEGGSAGASGTPGQGGGGGGGFDATHAGGGGGCGGCGGSGGQGGGGGGASIALLSVSSTVTLDAAALKTALAGAGGAGGAGGPGANGGTPGVGLCPGGSGGKGGAGGAGSGGAGGLSVGVVFKGPKPTLTATTITTGTAGAKGVGGAPGVNDGPDGLKADTFEAN